jgi:hypothetical protein
MPLMLLGYQGNLKEASSYVIIIITPPCMEGNLFIDEKITFHAGRSYNNDHI